MSSAAIYRGGPLKLLNLFCSELMQRKSGTGRFKIDITHGFNVCQKGDDDDED